MRFGLIHATGQFKLLIVTHWHIVNGTGNNNSGKKSSFNFDWTKAELLKTDIKTAGMDADVTIRESHII